MDPNGIVTSSFNESQMSKGRKKLALNRLLVLVVVGILGLAGYFGYTMLMTDDMSSARDVASKQVGFLIESKFDEALALGSTAFQEDTQTEDLSGLRAQFANAFDSGSVAFEVAGLNDAGTHGAVLGVMTGKDGAKAEVQSSVIKENGDWRVENMRILNVVAPSLEFITN